MYFSLKSTALATRTILCTSIPLAFIFSASAEQPSISENKSLHHDMDVITISHQRHKGLDEHFNVATGKTSSPDLADWLISVPGANINRNGPVTGIAQYRGLYGDRVTATLNGHQIVGAGPNAMDTPLSYSTPLIVDAMTVYRGVAPVTASMNTLGGAIDISMRKAEANQEDEINIEGDLQAGYRSNNKAQTYSAVTNISQGNFAVMLYGNGQFGDSMESGDGVLIDPTDFNKVQLGGDIRYSDENSQVGFSYHHTDTQDSGTPALPMDIEYIESQRFNLDGKFDLGQWKAEWLLGYFDADHGMTNFQMRSNSMDQKFRRNTAGADTSDFKFVIKRDFDFGELTFGTDGYFSTHDAVITNPNNDMFQVVNFNNVVDNRYSIFTQWQNQFGATSVQLGLRLKRVESDADEVSTSMAQMAMMDMGSMPMDISVDAMGSTMDTGMGMDSMDSGMDSDMNSSMDMEDAMPDMMTEAMPSMASLAGTLQDNFNNAKRDVTDTLADISLNTQTQLSHTLSLSIGLGLKNRAPSYQERYLWTPMEATGGLADGHTYIGDINLEAETAYQTDIGLSYQSKYLTFTPHIFYQRIDNYIQGTPLGMSDMPASMMANMMAGDTSPLKFSNVDATLYGIDANFSYRLTDAFQFSSIISYVKGERRDIDDNLYRIAPLNGQLALTYLTSEFSTNLILVAAAAQSDVSLTNQEQETAGYGLVNFDSTYYVNNALALRLGVHNLLNKNYQNHLGGYNRVKETEIPVMSRLPSEGMSVWGELTYSF